MKTSCAIYCCRLHPSQTVFKMQSTKQLFISVLDDLNDHAFTTTFAIHADDGSDYQIAVENLMHLPVTQEQIGTTVFRLNKTKTARVTNDFPFNQIHFLDQTKGPATVSQQLPVPYHGFQTAR